MKRLFPLVACSVLIAESAPASSIGIYADTQCVCDNISIASGGTGRVYVSADAAQYLPDRPDGAEFQIVDLPPGWTAQVTPNPAAIVIIGNPFSGGTNIAFAQGQPGGCVLLFTVDLTAASTVTDGHLQVTAHSNPSNPNFVCPVLVMDWVAYTRICVDGGVLHINSGQDCLVAVQPSSWSRIKTLYDW